MIIRRKFKPKPIDTYARVYGLLGRVIHVAQSASWATRRACNRWDWDKLFKRSVK